MIRRAAFPLALAAALALFAALAIVALLGIGSAQRSESGQRLPSNVVGGPSSAGTAARLPGESKSPAHYLGLSAASCASSNCHGGTQANGQPWKTSAFVFLQQDPHAQAFHVLFEKRSQEIIERLSKYEATESGEFESAKQQMKDPDWYTQQLEKRCVSCHATPLPANTGQPSTDVALHHYSVGVSCEACHGPASNWLNEHLSEAWTTHPSSKFSDSPQIDKAKFGFRELERTPIAAKTCASCHVGSAQSVGEGGSLAREVTHDLIAAGHPRLDFEFSAWLESMPRHWQDRVAPNSATSEWFAGQAASLQARSELMADQRHRGATSSAPWPEFSHFDCFGCHVQLRFPTAQMSREGTLPTVPVAGSSAKVYLSLEGDSAAEMQAIRDYLSPAAGTGTGAGVPTFAKESHESLNWEQLRDALLAYPKSGEIESWEELGGWYYAASAVLRDAEFAAQHLPEAASKVAMANEKLSTLKKRLEAALNDKATPAPLSRYTSPREWLENREETQSAFEAAKTALKNLAATNYDVP